MKDVSILTWLEQELSKILDISTINEQRLQATQRLILQFNEKLSKEDVVYHPGISRHLWKWYHNKRIGNTRIIQDEKKNSIGLKTLLAPLTGY